MEITLTVQGDEWLADQLETAWQHDATIELQLPYGDSYKTKISLVQSGSDDA